MALPSVFRIPRPKTFLRLMSLRTGTNFIFFLHLINKATAIYGILAVFTGFHLSPLQLSMYIYSLASFALTLPLVRHINLQSPLECLALGYLYLIDSVVNCAYTAAFSVAWFLVLAQHDTHLAPGGKMIDDTAGFTSPQYNVSRVDVVPGAATDPAAQLVGHKADEAAAGTQGTVSDIIFQSGSVASMTVIGLLWLVRVYFIFVVLAYARAVLRAYVVRSSQTPAGATAAIADSTSDEAQDPFAAHLPAGQGWHGKLGRTMVAWPRGYWLGADGDDNGVWVRDIGGKFARDGEVHGPYERERRRRAGTGPPTSRPIELDNVAKGKNNP